jgi:hypothetical protein
VEARSGAGEARGREQWALGRRRYMFLYVCTYDASGVRRIWGRDAGNERCGCGEYCLPQTLQLTTSETNVVVRLRMFVV